MDKCANEFLFWSGSILATFLICSLGIANLFLNTYIVSLIYNQHNFPILIGTFILCIELVIAFVTYYCVKTICKKCRRYELMP